MNWKILESIDTLDQIESDSHNKTVAIFKHSVSCGISAHVKHSLESQWNFGEDELDIYYLDLINNRPISNEIASRFKVIHQSPQILIIKNGEVSYHSSHMAVTADNIQTALVG